MTVNSVPVSQSRESDPLLANLIDEITRRLQAGEPIDMERYRAQCPERFEELVHVLPTLEAMVHFGRCETGVLPVDSIRSGGPETGILGDFRIGREIGRGGMGIVYEAEQISLGRRVALKVLPFAAVLDPRRLARFKNEAQAAASLDHPHIVAIYSVGCERGVHYYAMQHIEGRSLAQVIEQRRSVGPGIARTREPSLADAGKTVPGAHADVSTERSDPCAEYVRTVARLGAEAAEALEYAHQMGVVHRDVKPSNLLTDAHGHLWVTDFGLAMTRQDAGLTGTGDILGTLRYMSPEQARGDRRAMDHRSDIYSLGVTLYEMLALRPPFSAPDRQKLAAKIAEEDPRPLRQTDPAIPKDLETIVLTAMAREPQSRYATAQQLGDDLRRFLADEPIRARRPSLLERSARWSRRHRSLVAAAVLLLAVIATGSALSALVIARARDAAELSAAGERKARTEADRQRQRAEANFQRAVDAVNEMLTGVADKDLAGVPQLETLRRTLLEKALAFHQGFLEEKSSDPSVRQQTAQAHMRVGEILELLGRPADARKAFQDGLQIQQRLADEFPQVAEHRLALAVLQNRRGNLLAGMDQIGEASAAFEQARSLLQALIDQFGATAEYRMRLAHSRENLGLLLKKTGRIPEAEEAYRKTLAAYEDLAVRLPEVPLHQRNLAAAYVNLGVLLEDTGRFSEAEKMFRQARARQEQLLSKCPAVPEYRESLFVSISDCAMLLARMGRTAEAEKLFRDAQRIIAQLASDFPAVLRYQQKLAVATCSLGNALFRAGRLAEAEDCCRQSLALHRRLAAQGPAVPENESHMAHCQYSVGLVYQARKSLPEAEQAYREAIATYTRLARAHPHVPEYASGAAKTHAELSGLLALTGRLPEAEKACREAVAEYESLIVDLPANPDFRQQLAGVYLEHSEILASGSNSTGLADAEAATRTALTMCKQLASEFPDSREYRNNLAAAHRMLGRLQARTGRAGEAETSYSEAVRICTQLAAAAADNPQYQDNLRHLQSEAQGLRDLKSAQKKQ